MEFPVKMGAMMFSNAPGSSLGFSPKSKASLEAAGKCILPIKALVKEGLQKGNLELE